MKTAKELIDEQVGGSLDEAKPVTKAALTAMTRAYAGLEGINPADIGKLGVEPKEFATLIKKLGPLMDKLTAIQRVGK